MPAFSITAAHLAMSLFMRSVIASGVLARISMPSLLTFSWTSGFGKTSLMAPGEDLDDRLGRRSGDGNPVPTHDFKVFDTAFLDGGNGRQIGRSLSAGGSHSGCKKLRPRPLLVKKQFGIPIVEYGFSTAHLGEKLFRVKCGFGAPHKTFPAVD